ncbi:MAG TPA: alpha/beta hydrolase [Bacteroidales bacterium]|nr:alpha/beta hydrolase [Bacteroidales bacterium]
MIPVAEIFKFRFREALIAFRQKGSGQAVLLLHGFTGSSSIWEEYLEVLSDKFRVVALDLPGHGESEILAEVHTMDIMSELVNAVLTHLEIKNAVVIGHSMGGYVALNLAKNYPSFIKGLGLFHSTSLADNDEAREGREKSIRIIKEDHRGFLFNFIPGLFAPENQQKYAAQIAELVAQAKNMDKNAIVAAQEGMKLRTSTLDVLINANYPVMFIAGQKDPRIAFENIWVQMALTAEAHSLILRDVGHMGFIESRQECLDFTKSFVEACYKKSNL